MSRRMSDPDAHVQAAHMAQRKDQGLSHRAIAAEFGVSKSTAHRKITEIQRGYKPLGKAPNA
jgi:transposase